MDSRDLRAIASSFAGSSPAWTLASDDLNVNLIVLRHNASVPEHVNETLDVLLVGIEGSGTVTIDGQVLEFCEGHAVLVPKGARRSIHASTFRFGYLTCHHRRGGLWPSPTHAAPNSATRHEGNDQSPGSG